MVSVGADTVPNNTVCPADDAGVAVPFTITLLPNVSEPVKVRFPENEKLPPIVPVSVGDVLKTIDPVPVVGAVNNEHCRLPSMPLLLYRQSPLTPLRTGVLPIVIEARPPGNGYVIPAMTKLRPSTGAVP